MFETICRFFRLIHLFELSFDAYQQGFICKETWKEIRCALDSEIYEVYWKVIMDMPNWEHYNDIFQDLAHRRWEREQRERVEMLHELDRRRGVDVAARASW